MILQVQEGRQGMSLRQGFQKILGEGTVPDSASLPLLLASGRHLDWLLIFTAFLAAMFAFQGRSRPSSGGTGQT